MIPEPQHTSQSKQSQIKDLTSALLNALGINHSQQGQKIQSATIFLSGLFKKYSLQPNKKINQMKLSRLNGFFYKVCKQVPTDYRDIQLIIQIIVMFLVNEGNSPIDNSSFAANTCIWIAKYIQSILAVNFPIQCSMLLQTILKNKKHKTITPEQFQKTISSSLYFKDKQIIKSDEQFANKKYTYKGFMSETSVSQEIKQNFNTLNLFQNLYHSHPSRTQVLKLFILYCRQVDVQNLKQIFIQAFVNDKVHTKETFSAVLACLDCQFFTAEDFNQIVKILLKNNDRKILYSFSLKGFKYQSRYLEILAEELKPNYIDQLAQIFINQHEANNYYLLYLINKSGQKLSQKFLTLPKQKTVTNRNAIIIALCINHNIEIAHSTILRYFFNNQNNLTTTNKINYLKIAHFSYLNVPKSHLFTQIIKSIPHLQLDREANFQFLPKQNYQKLQLDKLEKEELNQFLSRYFGNSDQVYWIKLDLYAVCGKQIDYMQDFRKVQKIFQAPLENVISQMPTFPQNLMEVVLMGVNNKFSDHLIVNPANVGVILQWALDLYKRQNKKYRTLVQSYLKKNNKHNLLDLCLQIFEFNLDQKTNLKFDQEYNVVTSIDVVHKLVGLNFSEYFMAQHEQNQSLNALMKCKNIIIELQKFIKMLNHDSKTQNRKQLKAIVSQQSTPLRALKIISYLNVCIPFKKSKNIEQLKTLTQTLLSYIRPQFEYFKQLQTRSTQVNIPYAPIYQSLQFLLTINYENTIIFLSHLLKSNKVKQQKVQRSHSKKNKIKKAIEQSVQKSNIQSIADHILFCFSGDPNTLKSYESIITIITQIDGTSFSDRLAKQVAKWVSKIKMFHKNQYKDWRQKVTNYIKLWQALSSIITPVISIKQIQRHFLIMIDLLNTLYEKYKNEKDILTQEKKLLSGLYILYSMSFSIDKNQMVQQVQPRIPQQKLDEVISNNMLPELTTPHVYYCYDCSKKACSQCIMIFHKGHDKNYVGPGNQSQCHRGNKPKQNLEKKMIIKQKYKQKQGLQAYQRYQRDRQRQRQLQKLYMNLNQTVSPQLYMRLKQQKHFILKKGERGGANLVFQSQSIDAQFDQQKKKQENAQEVQKFQVKSCSQKQLSLRIPTLMNNAKKPHPIFQIFQNKKKNQTCKLNLTPLFNLLVRQLKSNTFFSNNEQNEQKNIPQFQAEMSNEKYTMFKNDCFRNNMAPGLRNTYLMNQQQNQNNFSLIKRGLITMNDKFITVLSGGFASQLHCLDSASLKNKFIKRQSQKRYKQNDVLENYQYNQNKLIQPSVLQITFSPFAHNLIAQISVHRIIFQKISRENRGKQLASEQASSQISKFQWLRANGLKSFYAYLANSVFISRIQQRDSNSRLKIGLGDKKIKDFCTLALNSKTIMMTLLDAEGKLYRAKVEVQTKKVPNFLDYQIPLIQPDQICSIICNGPSLYCTTTNGKIVVLNLNQQNNLISSPSTFPILQLLRSHKISQVNNKFKQITKIIKLRYITKHQNQIYLSCLLVKEAPNDVKRVGYFVLLTLNTQNKRSKIVMYNDQGMTDSYDFLMLSQKQFMFVCLQEDGELWTCKLNAHSKSNSTRFGESSLILSLSLNDISKYAQQIVRSNVLQKIQFYNKDRKPCFKQHQKISDRYKINLTQDAISFEVLQKYTRAEFATGIQFSYVFNPDAIKTSQNVAFSFLGNIYRYNVTKTRQIQIPLTIKQVLSLYFGVEQFKIKFLQGKPSQVVNVKDIFIYGVKSADKSIYSDSLNSLCEIMYIYQCPKDINSIVDRRLQRYFYNELDKEIKQIQLKSLQQYFTKKKFTLSEQNILMKLQLLRQSAQGEKPESNTLFQCFESIRNHILPNCNQKKQLYVSVQKLCHTLSQSSTGSDAMKLGHILNYSTQLDIYNIFRVYKTFLTQRTIDSYQDLLTTLCAIINTRTLDAFIILSVYPQILKEINRFFKKMLVDYRLYFKVNDFGLQKDEKLRLNKICRCLMRIIIQNYQLNKNRNEGNCQSQILLTLESIFCLAKREIHRQIKLNPFQYIQAIFQDGKYTHQNPPFNYLKLEAIDIQEQKKSVEQPSLLASQQQQKLTQNQQNLPNQPNIPNATQQRQYIEEIEESCEQYKEQEQDNRQIEYFAYQQLVQKNIEEQEDIQSDKNQLKNEQSCKSLQINTKKIYQYLSTCCNGMIPQQIQFTYYAVCENLLLQIFNATSNNGHHKYLSSDNLVFYVGLVYNLFQIVDKKISDLFANSPIIDFGHPYIQNVILPIIEAIDNKIDSPTHSILYLPLNNIISLNPTNLNGHIRNSIFAQCLIHYYSKNMLKSKFFSCLKYSNWHPDETKPAASLASVFRFEYFDLINQIYQIKYIGNLYLYLNNQKLNSLQQSQQVIKENVLKVVVKYNLKIYQNIMVIKKWYDDLQKSKINIAFQQLSKKPEQSLKVIMKSINKDTKSFIQDINKNIERVSCLESMLGVDAALDESILEILNSYYSYEQKN